MNRVIVIDERKGALKPDLSNAIFVKDGINKFEDDDIVIRVAVDGEVTIREPLDLLPEVIFIRVKSEPETSLEQARAQSAAREHGAGSVPSSQPGAVDKFKGMWSANQGEDDTGKSAGDMFR